MTLKSHHWCGDLCFTFKTFCMQILSCWSTLGLFVQNSTGAALLTSHLAFNHCVLLICWIISWNFNYQKPNHMLPESEWISKFDSSLPHVHIFQPFCPLVTTGGGRLCPVANEPTRIPCGVATTSETKSYAPWFRGLGELDPSLRNISGRLKWFGILIMIWIAVWIRPSRENPPTQNSRIPDPFLVPEISEMLGSEALGFGGMRLWEEYSFNLKMFSKKKNIAFTSDW